MKGKKRKLSIKKIIRFIIIILLIFIIVYGVVNLFGDDKFGSKKIVEKYLASDNNTVNLYTYSDENNETKVVVSVDDSVVRGTKVSTKGDAITVDNVEYTLVMYLDKEYYVVSSLFKFRYSLIILSARTVHTSNPCLYCIYDSRLPTILLFQ